MTIEQIELRKILSQMLADCGINQTTLKNMVKDVINEKIEKAIAHAFVEYNVERSITSKVIEPEIRAAVERRTRNLIDRLNIYVSLPNDGQAESD